MIILGAFEDFDSKQILKFSKRIHTCDGLCSKHIFTPYSSHLLLSIFSPKNADPICATNLYINECTGVTQDWKNFGQYGIYVDGNVSLFKFILSQKRVFIKIWTLLNTTITNSGNYDKSYFCLLVDHSHCGLTKVSRVITWMTCSNNCWTAMGSDKLYNQNNNGFRVYLNQPIEWKNDRAQTPSSPGNCTTRVKESATISRDLAEIILWKS